MLKRLLISLGVIFVSPFAQSSDPQIDFLNIYLSTCWDPELPVETPPIDLGDSTFFDRETLGYIRRTNFDVPLNPRDPTEKWECSRTAVTTIRKIFELLKPYFPDENKFRAFLMRRQNNYILYPALVAILEVAQQSEYRQATANALALAMEKVIEESYLWQLFPISFAINALQGNMWKSEILKNKWKREFMALLKGQRRADDALPTRFTNDLRELIQLQTSEWNHLQKLSAGKIVDGVPVEDTYIAQYMARLLLNFETNKLRPITYGLSKRGGIGTSHMTQAMENLGFDPPLLNSQEIARLKTFINLIVKPTLPAEINTGDTNLQKISDWIAKRQFNEIYMGMKPDLFIFGALFWGLSFEDHIALISGLTSKSLARQLHGTNLSREILWPKDSFSDEKPAFGRFRAAINYNREKAPLSLEILYRNSNHEWSPLVFSRKGPYWINMDQLGGKPIRNVCMQCHQSQTDPQRLSARPQMLNTEQDLTAVGYLKFLEDIFASEH